MMPGTGSSSETSSARHAWADLSSRWQRTLQPAGNGQPLGRRTCVDHAVQHHIGNDEELIRAEWFVVDHFQGKKPD